MRAKLKILSFTLIVLSLLLGIYFGSRPSPQAQAEESREPSFSKSPRPNFRPSQSPTSSEKLTPSLAQFPSNSVEHLQALELISHTVPGDALAEHLPCVLNSSYELSSALVALMELKGEEEEQLNQSLLKVLDEIGRQEAKLAVRHTGDDGMLTVQIPPFPEEGAKIRETFLTHVEVTLGPKRRALLEMQLLQHPTILGNFGTEAITLHHPNLEETYKREDLITLQVSTPRSPKQATERAFFISNFKKRFGHLLELDSADK